MGRLDRLAKKSEIFKLEGNTPEDTLEIEVKPMVFRDLVKFTEFEEKGNKDEALNFLIFSTLRRAMPEEEYSDEELQKKIDELPFDFIIGLVEVINRVNGLDKHTKFDAKKQ